MRKILEKIRNELVEGTEGKIESSFMIVMENNNKHRVVTLEPDFSSERATSQTYSALYKTVEAMKRMGEKAVSIIQILPVRVSRYNTEEYSEEEIERFNKELDPLDDPFSNIGLIVSMEIIGSVHTLSTVYENDGTIIEEDYNIQEEADDENDSFWILNSVYND